MEIRFRFIGYQVCWSNLTKFSFFSEEMAYSKPISISSDDEDYTRYVTASCEGNCSSLYIFSFVCLIPCV